LVVVIFSIKFLKMKNRGSSMARGGFRAGAYKAEKVIDFDGRKMTVREVMQLTGFSYPKTYRLYFSKQAGAPKLQKQKTKGIPADVEARTIKSSVPPSIPSATDDPLLPLENKDPLQYMLDVMNDPNIEGGRRDRMAVAAAPFLHQRACDQKPGKKEQQKEAADKAAAGKFSAGKAPKVVNMR
jgi:phage terminase small subunit